VNPVNGSEPLRRNDTTNYGPNRSNLGHARGFAYCVAMADVTRRARRCSSPAVSS
jgi:hypothetical protein